MRLNFFLIANLFFILGFHAQEVGKISGITKNNKNEILPFSSVSFSNLKLNKNFTIYTNEKGFFLTPNIEYGKYKVTYFAYGFEKKIDTVTLDAKQISISTNLETISYNLDEVVIKNKEYNNFQTRKLKAT